MGRIERSGVVYAYAEGTGGLQSIPDILQNFGTLHVQLAPPPGQDVEGQIVLVGLYSTGFELEININSGRFNLIRNGYAASQHLPMATGKSIHCFARWSPEWIDVTVLEHGYGAIPACDKQPLDSFQTRVDTPLTEVPDELIAWAREQSYLPPLVLGTEDDFFVEFINVLQQMQTTIDDTGSQRIFWDYGPTKGDKPFPKPEPQVTSALHMLLTDAAVRKDFQIIHQAGAAGGHLDFQINKVTANGRLAVLALEVKNAHATDLEHGLLTQLPVYMRSILAKRGVYLVLWFKGKQFDRPAELDFFHLRRKLEERRPRPPSNVRIMHLDLSIPAPPSNR